MRSLLRVVVGRILKPNLIGKFARGIPNMIPVEIAKSNILSNYQRTPLDPWRRLAAEIIRSGLYREGVSYVSGRCGQFWASMLGLDADYLFDMAGGVGPLEASAGCGCDKPHFFSDSMTRETDLEP